MRRRQHSRDGRRDLVAPFSKLSPQGRVVEVDPEDAIALRRGGEPEVELGSLHMNRYATGNVPQTTGVIVAQVADRDDLDVAERELHRRKRAKQWVGLARGKQWLDAVPAVMKTPAKRAIPDQCRVEAGIEQHSATLGLDEQQVHGAARPSVPQQSTRPAGSFPAKGKQEHPLHALVAHRSRPSCQGARSSIGAPMTGGQYPLPT